jgi:hypothetical protein
MNNHNFLPYDVTCLLPEANPYSCLDDKVYFPFMPTWYENKFEGKIIKEATKNTDYDKSIRDAWTILDALTYIEEKYNRYIEVQHSRTNCGWAFAINSKWYPTRTEAYIEGIKYVLETLNQQDNE